MVRIDLECKLESVWSAPPANWIPPTVKGNNSHVQCNSPPAGFCSNRITLGSAEHAKSVRRGMIPCVSHITREVKVIALTTCWKSISHTKCLDHAVKQQSPQDAELEYLILSHRVLLSDKKFLHKWMRVKITQRCSKEYMKCYMETIKVHLTVLKNLIFILQYEKFPVS